MIEEGATSEPKYARDLTREGANAVVKRLRDKASPVAALWRAKGLVNEAFVYGDQFPEEKDDTGRSIKDPGGLNSSLTPSIAVNIMAPLGSTWEALLTKDRPTGVARPGNAGEPGDVYDALITQAIIEHEQTTLESAQVVFDTVHLADMHGTAGIKITYDPADDQIVWAPLSIYNFLIDPSIGDAVNIDRAAWVIFEDYNMPLTEALGLFEAAQIQRAPTEKEHERGQAPGSPTLKGVEHVELWQRPSREWPDGLYICLVDGECVEVGDYPYVIEGVDGDPTKVEYPLPVVMMRVRRVRNSVWGNTNLTYCVPLQRAYNECVNKAQKLMRQVTNIHLVVPQSIQDTFDPAEENLIGFPDGTPESGKAIGYTKPGEISASIFQQRDFFEKAMQKVIGLNDITASSDNPRLSGTAIENMVQLDAQRNADVTRSLQAMVLAAWRLTLKLIGVFYEKPRIGSISGGDSQDVVSFVREDVRGTNVRIELGSEVDTMQPAKERITSDRQQIGAAGPLDMARAAASPAYAQSNARAQQFVASVAAGVQPDVSPDDIDPDVLEDTVRRAQARALAQKDKATWTRLEQFARLIPQLRAARQQAAMPPGGPAGPRAGAAPPIPPVPPAPPVVQPQPGA